MFINLFFNLNVGLIGKKNIRLTTFNPKVYFLSVRPVWPVRPVPSGPSVRSVPFGWVVYLALVMGLIRGLSPFERVLWGLRVEGIIVLEVSFFCFFLRTGSTVHCMYGFPLPQTLAKNLVQNLPENSSDKLTENCLKNMWWTSKTPRWSSSKKTETVNKPFGFIRSCWGETLRQHDMNKKRETYEKVRKATESPGKNKERETKQK